MSQEEVLNVILTLADALESAAVSAKQQIAKILKVDDHQDFSALKWETRGGRKGTYEQTTKSANNGSKLFHELAENLRVHGGFLQHENYHYWNHNKDPDTIDRRKA